VCLTGILLRISSDVRLGLCIPDESGWEILWSSPLFCKSISIGFAATERIRKGNSVSSCPCFCTWLQPRLGLYILSLCAIVSCRSARYLTRRLPQCLLRIPNRMTFRFLDRTIVWERRADFHRRGKSLKISAGVRDDTGIMGASAGIQGVYHHNWTQTHQLSKTQSHTKRNATIWARLKK